jgi:hypothetical protein
MSQPSKAVSNNTGKFPESYLIKIKKEEKEELVENFHQFNRLKHSRSLPKDFPERGLYMPATVLSLSKGTILKSKRATEATSLELNFAVLKFKHPIRRKRD